MMGYHGRMRLDLSRALLPPPFREALTARQWRYQAKVRMALLLLAIAIDMAILVVLRGNATIDQAVLRRFAVVNLSALLLSVALSAAFVWSPRWRKTSLLSLCAALEITAVVVWLQATGTLSSYFIIAGVLMVMCYRLYVGYAAATVALVTLVVLHGGAVLLEAGGVLRPEALFLGEPARVYQISIYRWIALASIMWTYVVLYVGSNSIVNKLRQKDHAIAEIQRKADRMAEEIEYGRLTGATLADSYSLGELIGRGGMGEVYSAEQLSDERPVAIKVLHGHLLTDPATLERFRREADIARRVPAAHTAKILEVGYDKRARLHFIVMERLRGEDLGAFLRRRGPSSLEVLLPIAQSAARSLDAAHGVGVVHRDLKPQNIFLVAVDNGAPDVRLLDFGLSKVPGEHETFTQLNAVLGTIGYLSPEQAAGRSDSIGPCSDLFAFAAVLYRAMTGRPPFQSANIVAAIDEVLHVRPPPPSSIVPALPRAVDAVMAVALAKAPEHRYGSAAELVNELAVAADGSVSDITRSRSDSLALACDDTPPVAAALAETMR